MAYFDTTWYVNFGDGSTTGYYAVAKRLQNAAVAAGQIVRQFTAPAVGSERCFICIVAGTTANVTDATWLITRGALTSDGTVFWQECTGAAAVNGDATNTLTWAQIKAIGGVIFAGTIIKRNNGASYQICRVGLTPGASEPAFSDTAGSSVADGAGTWVCIGSVSNFTGGQAPHARLANACATNWFAAGNTVYVGANHAESQATIITLAPTGSTTTVGKIICHNQSGSYPPASSDLTMGATISTSGAVNIGFTPAVAGGFYLYGLTFKVAVGQASTQTITLTAGSSWIFCDRCSFEIATTGAAASLTISSSAAGTVLFNNTTVKFANVAQGFSINGQFVWQNTGQILAAGSSVPTAMISTATGSFVSVVLEALDLSQLTGNINTVADSGRPGALLIKDCKLNASTTIATPSAYGSTIQTVRIDSAATGYKSTRYTYEGTETTETSIVRTGGAVDPTGQAQSRKIVTTANAQWLRPFRAEPYAVWNPTTGANVTVTVCGTVNAGALPNNDDIWVEVEYLGSATDPLGKIVTTTKASVLASNAAVASDSSTWGGGGSGAGWSPFKLTATLSSPQPQMAGYLHARIRAAKASATYYIDPKIELGISAALGAPLDAVASVTGAWSLGRDMLTAFAGGTRYNTVGSDVSTIKDQSGHSIDFVTVVNRPLLATAFPTNVACADFDGVNDFLSTASNKISTLFTSSSGALVVSVIIDAVTLNDATPYNNHGILTDDGGYMGLLARNLSGVTFYSYNWDGSADTPSTTGVTSTAYILMWRHHGGNVYLSINGGAEVSVASGNTSSLAGALFMGAGSAGGSFCNMKLAEAFTSNDGSQTAALAAAIANMKTYIGA